LPLPSYVELTSLKTGKTILVRAERRGPMNGANLVELSPGAAAQLGLEGATTPVRVRRVNPPEPERALLRAGQQAAARMDTPMALVAVLMRKLEPGAVAPAPAPVALPTPLPQAAVAAPPPVPKPQVKAPVKPKPAVAAANPAANPATPVPQAAMGKVFVQVGAFSSAARAGEVARKLGGTVSPSGKFFRVRIGGFTSAVDAGGALAKAKAAGYSDARIQRAD
jgi:rare lipoprotein A